MSFLTTLLGLILNTFGKALAEVFSDWRRDQTIEAKGRAEAVAEGERNARAIQQEITNAVASPPADRGDLAARVERGGL